MHPFKIVRRESKSLGVTVTVAMTMTMTMAMAMDSSQSPTPARPELHHSPVDPFDSTELVLKEREDKRTVSFEYHGSGALTDENAKTDYDVKMCCFRRTFNALLVLLSSTLLQVSWGQVEGEARNGLGPEFNPLVTAVCRKGIMTITVQTEDPFFGMNLR
ncbi:unnamed protein product [Darwinula stevensoni]|uniref:Uncharacterized protein n=1 Tax=Darwinula stevensoni TaxID=69355 RepID=A0A7R9AF90_9CRUS|nr:unnamed protein product [Darwinula stevensoni]CAG0903054.1 unnamed protein product [Darwinula stevensoni]